jgi:hypothetical protein
LAGKEQLDVEGTDNLTAKQLALSSNAAVTNKNPAPN